MIKTDAGLAQTRELLANMEAVLASYRKELLPHNEFQYHLFTEGVIELINQFRADIDAYLGTTTPPEPLGPDDLSVYLTPPADTFEPAAPVPGKTVAVS